MQTELARGDIWKRMTREASRRKISDPLTPLNQAIAIRKWHESGAALHVPLRSDPESSGMAARHVLRLRAAAKAERIAEKANPQRVISVTDFINRAGRDGHIKRKPTNLERIQRAIELAACDLAEKTPAYPALSSPQPFKQRKYYPTLYIGDRSEDDLPDLSKEGTATVKYRVRSRSTNENEEGKRTGSMSVEIINIDPHNEDEESERGLAARLLLTEFGAAPRSLALLKQTRGFVGPATRAAMSGSRMHGLDKAASDTLRKISAVRVKESRNAAFQKQGKGITKPFKGKTHEQEWYRPDAPETTRWNRTPIRDAKPVNRIQLPFSRYKGSAAMQEPPSALRSNKKVFFARARDGEGQFSPQQPMGPDPIAMRSAYSPQTNYHRQAAQQGGMSGIAKAALIAGGGLVGLKVGKRFGMAKGLAEGRASGASAVRKARSIRGVGAADKIAPAPKRKGMTVARNSKNTRIVVHDPRKDWGE